MAAELSRDDLTAALRCLKKIDDALADLPHRRAVPAMQEVETVRSMLGELLPGGDPATCPSCEGLFGADELETAGDERMCKTCSEPF